MFIINLDEGRFFFANGKCVDKKGSTTGCVSREFHWRCLATKDYINSTHAIDLLLFSGRAQYMTSYQAVFELFYFFCKLPLQITTGMNVWMN